VPASWGEVIPRNREEALRVLGIGVTPDASEVAIKKIVDGLRLSWHPDRANGSADRQIRELRLKQINAAWEIIMGKRVEA
jgi:curved DNA-binding protein CbpA